MTQHSVSTTHIRRKASRKLALTAMFASLAFVLSTFVYVPSMAPFQHFVDVLAAALLGPWYACGSALLCGSLRMLSGRSIQAITGAVFGPILGGLLYRKFPSIWSLFIGEVIGTGIFGALASYPLMKWLYGLDAQSPLYYIPFYMPSAIMGAGMGIAALLILKRNGVFARMQKALAA